MGWKPKFKFSNQSFSNPLSEQIEPWTYWIHEGEKKNPKIGKKIGGKGLKVKKL